ncbi:MAG: ankyrin repeat domain-containing protein [Alphaproteobacteria bacterium]
MGIFFDNKQEKLDRKIYKAIEDRNIEKLREAFAAGGAVEAKGYWSWMYYAVNNNFSEAIPLLLERGCAIDGRGPYGYTPLRITATTGRTETAELLLKHGADIKAKDETGWTPLHGAAYAGKMDMIAFLLEQGADIAARDNHMNTAADIASKQYPRIAEFLWQKMGINAPAAAPLPEDGWHLTGEDEIAHVSNKPAVGYRITEMFNFNAQIYTRIAENTRTQAESNSVKTFDDLQGSPLLEQAYEAFRARGGRVDLYTLDKPKLPPPGLQRGGPQS